MSTPDTGASPGPDVIVIGGGLHGCSAAFHIASAGRKVLLLERDVIARHASSASAGGVRRLFRHPAEIPLTMASLELWHAMKDMLGDTGDFRPTGQLRVAETEEEMAKLETRVKLTRSMGYDHEVLVGRARMFEIAPALGPQCLGAIHVERDGYAFPYKSTLAFRNAAAKLGADIREGVGVSGILRDGGRWKVATNAGEFAAPVLVNAAGAWGGRIAEMVGERVPLKALALMMMVSARMPHFLDPTVGTLGRQMSFKQMQSGAVVVGGGHRGTPDLETGITQLDFRKLKISAETIGGVFPIMRKAEIVRAWAGIEGCTPDDIPYIGPSRKHDGLYHSFAFCGHGFQLGPIVGSITAELITKGRTNLPIEPFRIDRFGPDPDAVSWEASRAA